ncbi:unnamed protein product, partial [Mesorhabditis belari]|uniref:protein-tyrosine-phosphatase n=1 Tax=Mesorhabditis belari TaxID=2138241 RepID=A0AAF3EG02_9BILA
MNCFKAPFFPLIDLITRKIVKLMRPNGEETPTAKEAKHYDSGLSSDDEPLGIRKVKSRPSFDHCNLDETGSSNDSIYGQTPVRRTRSMRLFAKETVEKARCETTSGQRSPSLKEDCESVRLYFGTEKARPRLSIHHAHTFSGQKRCSDLLKGAEDLWDQPVEGKQQRLSTSLPDEHYDRKSALRQLSTGSIEKGEFSTNSPKQALPCILEVVYKLPIISPVISQAFRFISRETLWQEFKRSDQSFSDWYVLIDCRYNYEYEGGHLDTAINLHDPLMLHEFFFSDNHLEMKTKTAKVPIFYCEFSEVRGPKMANELRKIDRTRNAGKYPHVDYPEIYVLAAGYKGIWNDKSAESDQMKTLCTPSGYVAMHDKNFSADLRRFQQHKSRRNKPRPSARSILIRKLKPRPIFAKTPKKTSFSISDNDDSAPTPTRVSTKPVAFPNLDDSDDAEQILT